MELIPEWLPNIHPMVVHFPIALLCAAVLFDIVALFRRDSPAIQDFPVILYVLGTVSAMVAFFTGRHAADHVEIPTRAILALNAHADLALYTVVGFGIYTLIRLLFSIRFRSDNPVVRIALVLLPLFGVLMVAQTAERGARLVYEYGIGVSGQPVADAQVDNHHLEDTTGIAPAVMKLPDGSWSWHPGAGSESVLRSSFNILEGSLDDVPVVASDSGLSFVLDDAILFIATMDSLASIEVLADLDPGAFSGKVTLAHNITSSNSYDFVEMSDGRLVHGRLQNGMRSVFGSSTFSSTNPIRLRSVSAGTHFRAYVDGRQAAHGHGDPAPAGGIGLRMEGTGLVRLVSLAVTSLDDD